MKNLKKKFLNNGVVFNILILVFIFFIFPFFVAKVYGLLGSSYNNAENVVKAENVVTTTNTVQNNEKKFELNGVWFSYLEWKKYHDGKNENDWRKTVENEIIPNIKSLHIDNVFVHAVAFCDAMYSSKILPTSRVVAKEYGKNINYDPFKVFIEILHKNNIKVHAWINPLRSMTDLEFSKIPDSYIHKKWYKSSNKSDYYIKDITARYWLNPANPDVRRHIKEVAGEILTKYKEIEGIHIDDYFYPSGLSDNKFLESDLNYYNKVKPNVSIKDWRTESVTNFVKDLYDISCENKKIFGVSPQGNIQNNINNMFFNPVDVISKGYLHYIMPQIYYGFENETCPFKETVSRWSKLILDNKPKDKEIKFYVGLAVHKLGMREDIYAGKGKHEWSQHNDILKRQVEFLKSFKDCCGFVFFSYDSFFAPLEDKKPIINSEKINLLSILN